MNLEVLEKYLKGLTPHQKVDFLKSLLRTEKNKEKQKKLHLFLERTEKEKSLLDEEIKNLEWQTRKEPEEEKPLESIVQQTIEENPEIKKAEKKLTEVYGTNNVEKNIQYLSPTEREKKEYKSIQEEITRGRFELRDTDEAKKLEKERKKYETGIS